MSLWWRCSEGSRVCVGRLRVLPRCVRMRVRGRTVDGWVVNVARDRRNPQHEHVAGRQVDRQQRARAHNQVDAVETLEGEAPVVEVVVAVALCAMVSVRAVGRKVGRRCVMGASAILCMIVCACCAHTRTFATSSTNRASGVRGSSKRDARPRSSAMAIARPCSRGMQQRGQYRGVKPRVSAKRATRGAAGEG